MRCLVEYVAEPSKARLLKNSSILNP